MKEISLSRAAGEIPFDMFNRWGDILPPSGNTCPRSITKISLDITKISLDF